MLVQKLKNLIEKRDHKEISENEVTRIDNVMAQAQLDNVSAWDEFCETMAKELCKVMSNKHVTR